MAAQSKMADFFTFYFQKISKNLRIKFFPFYKMIFLEKILIFFGKTKKLKKKIENGGQKSRWHRVNFF
jgi:hypothetical protein